MPSKYGRQYDARAILDPPASFCATSSLRHGGSDQPNVCGSVLKNTLLVSGEGWAAKTIGRSFLNKLLVTIALVMLLPACEERVDGVEPAGGAESVGRAPTTEAEAAFLANHWKPIAPQGPPPEHFSTLESSLAPESCGACHPQQYQDWQTSLHAKSMGPGIWGQLVEMGSADAGFCQRCHAPLAEQMGGTVSGISDPVYDPVLQQQGLVCAACHVRNHQRFGPPPRDDSIAASDPEAPLPHDGFSVETAFTKGDFCRGCHQFEPGEYALNGKLIENTFEEWKASPYPAQGIHCQDCHMPERRHLWRGIHDRTMVAEGVEIRVEIVPGDEVVAATITVANTGVGHYFPTYVTPKVFVRGELLDMQARVLPATVQQATIGREVTLNLSQELFDTRIPPGEKRSVVYEQRVPAQAGRLRITVEVHPDHFYRQFFEAVLAGGGGATGRAELQSALAATKASIYTLYQKEFALR